MRVLVVSHEWDARVPGGAQRSATALAQGLTASGHEVTLASVVDPEEFSDGVTEWEEPGGHRHLLVPSATDFTTFSWSKPTFTAHWEEAVTSSSPDVVHLHHYYKVGMEVPLLVRRLAPQAGIVLTLHEYLAICLMSGQMVDQAGHLCLRSSPSACATCVSWPEPTVTARRDYIRNAMNPVDLFLTPSDFARARYVDWGLPPDTVRVVPNVVEAARETARPITLSSSRGLRLVYLGQHTPFKGLEVLLEAVWLADIWSAGSIGSLDIYGGGSDNFGDEFVDRLQSLQSRVTHIARFAGSYQQDQLRSILVGLDAIVVPSTWWENSPVVIEEALAAGVPVICSNIGGMAEKVRHGVDGWHFEVGNPASLASLLVWLAGTSDRSLPAMRHPTPPHDAVTAHVEAYTHAIGSAQR